MLEHALALAHGGIRVFPVHYPTTTGREPACSCHLQSACRHVGKHPVTAHGFTEATVDPTVIKRWWRRDPNYNIGLPTGAYSFDVLDDDPGHGGDVSLRALQDKHGPLPETLRSRTGGGGAHFAFGHIPGTKNINHGKIGAGLDFKTDGGYIVAPPSLHASGARYEWENPTTPIAPAPAWLAEILQAEDPVRAANGGRYPIEFWNNLAGEQTDGARHKSIGSVAGLLLNKASIAPVLAVRLIHGYNQICCCPPKPDDEVDAIIKHILKKNDR